MTLKKDKTTQISMESANNNIKPQTMYRAQPVRCD